MNFWDWLNRLGPGWPTARGWYAAALCLQTCVIIWMVAQYPELGTNEFFKTLATAIVITGWIGFAVSGRDNRLDREQVGEAHKLASEALAGWRDAQPLPLTNAIPDPLNPKPPHPQPGEDR